MFTPYVYATYTPTGLTHQPIPFKLHVVDAEVKGRDE